MDPAVQLGQAKLDRSVLARLHQAIGEIALVLADHRRHRHLFLGDLRRRVVPPVLLGQYRVVRDTKGRTFGFASWAKVNRHVHDRLMDGHFGLRPQDWHCGENVVFMDVVAPTPDADRQILQNIAASQLEADTMWRANPDAVKPGLIELPPSPQR